MSKNKYNGKIGFVKNRKLGIKLNPNSGHYVYIRKDNGSTVDVNVITSLEDSRGNIEPHKVNKLRKGYIYSIPKKDGNFNRWSAVNLTGHKTITKNDISLTNKNFKRRHKWFIGKFGK